MVDRAVEREGDSITRACENRSISVLDQSRQVHHHRGKTGPMVGDLAARRSASTITRWSLCRLENFRPGKVRVSVSRFLKIYIEISLAFI